MSDRTNPHLTKAITNLALLEGMALMAVTVAFIYTNDLKVLIGGTIGVIVIFTPLLFRKIAEIKSEQRVKPNEISNLGRES